MIESWREKAACVGVDPAIFHRISLDDPAAEGLTRKQVKEMEISNFKKALKVCAGCPVESKCEEAGEAVIYSGGSLLIPSSTYSVWGGELPDGYAMVMPGRPVPGSSATLENRTCKRGHKGDWRREGEGLRCRECDRQREAEGGVGKHRTPEQKHEEGDYDHKWEPGMKGGRAVCKACRRQVGRTYKDRRRKEGTLDKRIAPRKAGGVDWDARHEATKGHKPEWSVTASGKYCIICSRTRDQNRRHRIRWDRLPGA